MRNVQLIRAIGSEFIRRKYSSAVMLFVIAALISVVLIVWLVNISAWWLLLAVPVILGILIGIVIAVAMRILVNVASPTLTKEQKSGVRDFVDKLERVAENIQTPPFMILFRIVRDTIRPRDKTFIQAVAEESASLRPDFLSLQKLFK